MSLSIKLQKINSNVCKEYKRLRAKRDDRIALKFASDENVPAKQADFLILFLNEKN